MAAGVLVLLSACRQKMSDQPRYEPFEASAVFEDSMSMRGPVAGTVPREPVLGQAAESEGHERAAESDGHDEGGESGSDESGGENQGHEQAAETGGHEHGDMPFAATRSVLERGRERFDIYCAPCHGRDGYGMGIIVKRGLRQPPSFHSERLRRAPLGHYYQVMTDGFGAMFSYASRITPADRWAIAGYIRALQLSQNGGTASEDPPGQVDSR